MTKRPSAQRKLQLAQSGDATKPSVDPHAPGRVWLEIVLVALLLFVVIFALYSPSMRGPFIMDDNAKITNNADIKGDWHHIFSRLVYPYEKERKFERNDPSRPLVYLTFAVNYRLGGLDPNTYHLFNVLLHFLNTLLIWAMMRLLWQHAFKVRSTIFPLLGALFYAVHPLNTSTVSYVFSRSDLLVEFFFLSSFILYVYALTGEKRRMWAYTLSLCLFVPALYSKQLAVMLPFTLLLFDLVFLAGFQWRELRKRAKFHLPFWGLLSVFIIGRYLYFGALGDLESMGSWDAWRYFITQPFAIMKYLQMLLVPIGLSIDHGIPPAHSLLEPKIISSWLAIAALFAALVVAYRKKTDAAKLVVFCLGWFIITIAPTSSFLPTTAVLVDNRVYLPGLGWVGLLMLFYYLWAGREVSWKPWTRALPLLIALLHIAVLGVMAVQRNNLFQDTLTIWKDAADRYPEGGRALFAVANILRERGQIDAAISEYQAAAKADPKHPYVHEDLAEIYYAQGKVDLAAAELLAEIKNRPDYTPLYINLGNCYCALRQYPQAIEQYQKAIMLDPSLAIAYYELGTLYLELKDYRKAVPMCRKSLELNPKQPSLQEALKELESLRVAQ